VKNALVYKKKKKKKKKNKKKKNKKKKKKKKKENRANEDILHNRKAKIMFQTNVHKPQIKPKKEQGLTT